MMIYLLKTIFCSGIFYGFYFLFLEKEKMHRFNRFYLLLSLISSFVIPLTTVENQVEILPIIEGNTLIYNLLSNAPWLVSSPTTLASAHEQTLLTHGWLVETPTTEQGTIIPQGEVNYLPIISWIVYGIITLILLSRLGRNLFLIKQKIRKNTSINFKNSTLILLEENIIPHSFLRYIFLNKNEYENGNIEAEILQHELTHVRQKHSFDVILMEIIHCIYWFNPILILYRKAVQLDHEFLADEAVIQHCENPISYQYLLLHKVAETNSLLLTSQFNYLITKKRLIMMTKNTSPQRAFLIKLLFVPLFVGTVLMLSTRVDAQEKILQKAVKTEPQKTDSRDLMLDYRRVMQRYIKPNETIIRVLGKDMSSEDLQKVKEIYAKMSDRQKEIIRIMGSPTPPTEKQFNAFKNAKKFGLWIDDKKVKNSVLNNYKNEDFGDVGISNLYGAAKTNVNYEYQVGLMTKEYYARYRKEKFDKPFEEMTLLSRSLNKVKKK